MDAKQVYKNMVKERDALTQKSFKLLEKIGQCEMEKKDLEGELNRLSLKREDLTTAVRVWHERVGI